MAGQRMYIAVMQIDILRIFCCPFFIHKRVDGENYDIEKGLL